MSRVLPFLLVQFYFLHAAAQDSSSEINPWQVNGYMKYLQLFSVDKNFSDFSYTNLLHNRINIKWKPSEKFNGAVELRNRLYVGDEVKKVGQYGRQLRNENEAVNLSAIWYSNDNTVLHSNIERLWLEYRKPKWNIRAGRQRINWGMANIWNPNDVFNTYNFLDFDYEERPGSDAVKIHYMVNDLSNAEIAIASSGEREETIAAAKYFINYRGYDLQFIAGVFQKRFTTGIGWAGSIGEAGFKGEGQLYFDRNDSGAYFNLTMETDYIFKNGWYVSAGLLYNHRGLNEEVNDWSTVNFKISPLNLMPAKWNVLLISSKEFTPLFTGSLNLVYSPGMNMFIAFPYLRYNLLTNVDMDLVLQSFFAELQDKFQGIAHLAFLRLKWNF